ncbi:hypothetical protein BKA61DRAFT_581950 [Leptodontidium sp. MPI-SDFR-AT-0119]|nr:hypothetical protein BKA61DRAFT_581950 [Leptodontidium sp. MPI-SDFR-AT-0119]
MHEQGISYGDIKDNNICSVPRISETVSVLNYLPLGFTLNCRSKETKNISLRLVKMQKISASQIAIDLLGQYINPKINSLSHGMAASVDSLNNRFLSGSCDNNQEGLLSILRAAEDLPTSASPLVCPLIPRIPSPSLDLIENIVNIFYKANKPKQALNYLAVQIKASQQQQHNHSNGLNEPSFTFLYFKKLHVARKYYYLSNRHITALQALLPILENRFGVTDVQTLEIKRELSLALFDSGDKEQARLL